MARRKKNNNYVNNKEFFQLMVERKQVVSDAISNDKPIPRVSDKIGKIIMSIATNLAYRQNFIKSQYREEMIGDAIENCIKYIDKYNPDESNNPFSYFTQCCFNSFIQRIKKEERKKLMEQKMIKNAGIEWSPFYTNEFDNESEYAISDNIVLTQENYRVL